MAEKRNLSERYAGVGADLIASEPSLGHIKGSGAAIAFLSSDAERKSRGRPVLGTCERVPAKWSWAVPFDFAITVFEPNVVGLTDGQIRTLLLHVLMHVGVDQDKDGNEVYRVVPHDVEDFRAVLERFGIDWSARAQG